MSLTEVAQAGETHALREPGEAAATFVSETDALRAENTTAWEQFAGFPET
jgi:hypothetical protein